MGKNEEKITGAQMNNEEIDWRTRAENAEALLEQIRKGEIAGWAGGDMFDFGWTKQEYENVRFHKVKTLLERIQAWSQPPEPIPGDMDDGRSFNVTNAAKAIVRTEFGDEIREVLK